MIHLNQNGFVNGRYIGNNVRLLLDLLDYADINQVDGAILFTDFYKAFDSIHWSFLKLALRKFGFKDYFVDWINTLYSDPTGMIINNGFLSQTFTIGQGVRQGCPLSALLFLLCIEVLACKIRQNELIPGFKIADNEFKISLLAEDAVIFVDASDSNDSLQANKPLFSRWLIRPTSG